MKCTIFTHAVGVSLLAVATQGAIAMERDTTVFSARMFELMEPGETVSGLRILLGQINESTLPILSHFVNSFDRTGRTALHYAARYGDVEKMQILLQCGAEKEAKTLETERTPLHEAVLNGQEAAVRLLLEARANPNAIDHDKRTPLFYAATSPLGNLNRVLIKMLLDYSAQGNVEFGAGTTLLHQAAGLGDSDLVFALLACGANSRAEDIMGKRPSAYTRDDAIKQMLLRDEVRVHVLTLSGRLGMTPPRLTASGSVVSGVRMPEGCS